MTKQQFIIDNLKPYILDPSTCGIHPANGNCEYLTFEGKMCVAGKNMLDPGKHTGAIYNILTKHTQEEVFKPECVGILNNTEWDWMQRVHDGIASKVAPYHMKGQLKNLEVVSGTDLTELKECLKLLA